ncbi:Sel1 repeat protein (fragment) [Verrucomicrobia bacterium]
MFAALGLTLIPLGPVRAGTKFTLETAQTAAKTGNAEALYFLAQHYAKGDGVPQNYTNAAIYMRKAADRGNTFAQNDLGAFYARGLGVEQDFQEAAKWYRKAAENGDALAQFTLGTIYSQGRGVPKDPQESIKWYRKSARHKQADAMLALGDIYLRDHGVAIDCPEAVRWFRKALKQGRVDALNSLGALYEAGARGVPQNVRKAFACYHQAAEKGNAKGQMNLGRMYLEGVGVEADFAQAYKWFYLAHSNGDRIANHYLQVLQGDTLVFSAKLTPAQIAEAKRQAAELQKRIQGNKAAR